MEEGLWSDAGNHDLWRVTAFQYADRQDSEAEWKNQRNEIRNTIMDKARWGDGQAFLLLADCYRDGIGVKPDFLGMVCMAFIKRQMNTPCCQDVEHDGCLILWVWIVWLWNNTIFAHTSIISHPFIDFPSNLHRICIEFATNLQRRNIGGKSKQSFEIKGLNN